MFSRSPTGRCGLDRLHLDLVLSSKTDTGGPLVVFQDQLSQSAARVRNCPVLLDSCMWAQQPYSPTTECQADLSQPTQLSQDTPGSNK